VISLPTAPELGCTESDGDAALAAPEEGIATSVASTTDLEPVEPAERVARIIVVLFHGIWRLGVLQPEVADDDLIETAIALISRGLGFDI